MKKKENLITAIIVIISISIIGILAFFWHQTTQNNTNKEQDTPKQEVSAEGTPDGDGDYIEEVRYIGGIGYPKVYDIPFEKNDFYLTNKELWEIDSSIPNKCVEAAEKFANLLFCVSARNITNDETSRIQALKLCMDQEWCYEEDYAGNGYLVDEYIEKWNDYVVNNNISMESKFITDSSLVCENGLIYVRGMLEYEVFSSSDSRLEVKDGKQTVMIEIAMHRAMENMAEYDVVGFDLVKIEEPTNVSVLSVMSAGAITDIVQ